jgi:hypothetical protein
MKKKVILKPGDKINRLTVLQFDHIGNHYRRYFIFRCDCGTEKVILGSLVSSGNTKSCGCYGSEVRKAKLLPDNLGAIRQIILGYKRHAKRRGFNFLLSENDVINLIKQNCYYCGEPPSNIKKTKNCHNGWVYSGIDRVNSKGNYTIENSVPCCEQCNRAKMALSKDDFINWVKRVYKKAMATQWG